MDIQFSIIVPVYNRPMEVDELLTSLSQQTQQDFEVVIVEDGSKEDCKKEVARFSDTLDISYYFKENSGPGDSRNYGMRKARGNYFLIFDSDCLIPPHYIEEVKRELTSDFVHCFGGPDAAHDSFSDIQKAINYAMTSFLTTGGIRGKESSLTRFQPRSFNMGISKEAFEKTGGFGDIHPGEDPDLSLRIWALGYSTRLFPKAYVYHKRRISFQKFRQQVYKFGLVRPILNKWHPDSSKLTYWLPSLFILFVGLSVIGALLVHWSIILPLLFYIVILFVDAFRSTGNLNVALIAVQASVIQLFSYGRGFLESQARIHWQQRPEREVFPNLFFK